MFLSYAGRSICFALCSAGLLLCALELAAWLAASALLKQSASGSARRSERSLFLLAILTRLGPWLIVLGTWLPSYMHGEENLAQERVSLLCVCGAVCVLAWSCLCVVRAVHAWLSAKRFRNACRESEERFEGRAILVHPGARCVLAVVGIFRPQIIASMPLLAGGRFSRRLLNLAFQHEAAHIQHRDNLKMLMLSVLPHVPFVSRKRPSLDRQWRLAAEMAADEHSAEGSAERSVLLAELLVSMVKDGQQGPQGSFALLSCAEDLERRVDRLLQKELWIGDDSQGASKQRTQRLAMCTLAACLAAITALCLLGLELGHPLAETLLHLG